MERPIMERMKRRQDFLAAARALSWAARGTVVQTRIRGDNEPARVGFTVTRKLGNAVARNRIKRRLREAVRLSAVTSFKSGHDYVFIGRAASAERPFDALRDDVELALNMLNAGKGQPPAKRRQNRRPARSGPRQHQGTT